MVNYLAGKPLAPVGDSGSSCTKDNMSYEVTFRNKKLRIFDTQGINDTAKGFTNGNGNVASRIKFQLMNESSTRQIDAVWIVHAASSQRCYLEAIFSDFEASIGPDMRGMTAIIITQCDTVMESGDYLQCPKEEPFKVPEDYNEEDDESRKELFWVKIMQPGRPFEFAKDKSLHSKPICWTNKPANLSRKLKMPVKTIEETQEALLYQSLLNSAPVQPQFLQEYDRELNETAAYLREREKIAIYTDEMKDGFEHFTARIDAYLREEEREQEQEKKEARRKKKAIVGGLFGGLVAGSLVLMLAPVAASALVVATAAASAGVLGGGLGGVAGYRRGDSSESDTWKERTEKISYKAPPGHVIHADPTYEESGQGRVRILTRDEHGFDFEITAFQGEFSVVFTSYERWMHSSASGDFEYPKSILEYKADVR